MFLFAGFWDVFMTPKSNYLENAKILQHIQENRNNFEHFVFRNLILKPENENGKKRGANILKIRLIVFENLDYWININQKS